MLAYVFSFVHRQVLALMIEPIKRDLQISDTQFSLLQGFAFSLFYAVMGMPIAYLADRFARPGSSRSALRCGASLTAACGASQNFLQMFDHKVKSRTPPIDCDEFHAASCLSRGEQDVAVGEYFAADFGFGRRYPILAIEHLQKVLARATAAVARLHNAMPIAMIPGSCKRSARYRRWACHYGVEKAKRQSLARD